jgi:hypothetical protein
MPPKRENEANDEKLAGSKKGKQHVAAKEDGPHKRLRGGKKQEKKKDGGEDGKHGGDGGEEKEAAKTSRGEKRKSGSQDSSKDKKQARKSFGSKHDDENDEPGQQASAERLPDVGQTVSWKAMPGWVKGEVKEILRKAKTVNGKNVKATEEDPRVVLKSHGPSGKLAVHKPEAIYF